MLIETRLFVQRIKIASKIKIQHTEMFFKS